MNYNQKYAFILIGVLTFALIGNNTIINLLELDNNNKTDCIEFKSLNTPILNLKKIFTIYPHCGDSICQP
jgi:hypothetical protein